MALRPERNTVNVNTPAARQADAALDPELKIYLMKLALSWTQAAGETVERELRASSGRPDVTKSASRPLPQ